MKYTVDLNCSEDPRMNFILCYKDELEEPSSIDDHSNILFYLNPFSKGDIFNKKEIDTFLQQLKIEKDKNFLVQKLFY